MIQMKVWSYFFYTPSVKYEGSVRSIWPVIQAVCPDNKKALVWGYQWCVHVTWLSQSKDSIYVGGETLVYISTGNFANLENVTFVLTLQNITWCYTENNKFYFMRKPQFFNKSMKCRKCIKHFWNLWHFEGTVSEWFCVYQFFLFWNRFKVVKQWIYVLINSRFFKTSYNLPLSMHFSKLPKTH